MKQSRYAMGNAIVGKQQSDVKVEEVNKNFKQSLQVMLFCEEALKIYRTKGTKIAEDVKR